MKLEWWLPQIERYPGHNPSISVEWVPPVMEYWATYPGAQRRWFIHFHIFRSYVDKQLIWTFRFFGLEICRA